MTRKGRRLALIGSAVGLMALAVGLILFALKDNIVFFYAPAELAEKGVQPGTRLRIGGLVKQGTVERAPGKPISFTVTDNVKDVAVTYDGLLPDLFREGQGVVVEGVLETKDTFRADSVLAKHDETYMPREVADALKKQGLWRGGTAQNGPPTTQSQGSP
ncbi:MAG: cytochrome c maturation protein CcmE [Methylobacteriaceae bacterium]|nr:cytochrome c maturation protein CcmE [Methylobacteriaceae bacterium]